MYKKKTLYSICWAQLYSGLQVEKLEDCSSCVSVRSFTGATTNKTFKNEIIIWLLKKCQFWFLHKTPAFPLHQEPEPVRVLLCDNITSRVLVAEVSCLRQVSPRSDQIAVTHYSSLLCDLTPPLLQQFVTVVWKANVLLTSTACSTSKPAGACRKLHLGSLNSDTFACIGCCVCYSRWRGWSAVWRLIPPPQADSSSSCCCRQDDDIITYGFLSYI